MKLSDYLASVLAKNNVKYVFQIIGGASVHMVHSIAKRKDLKYICMQHEQAAAMAAESYSRISKNLGVAMATSGPGMTNLITGIACAYFDSIPTLYITGQVNTYESKKGRNVRQIGFQETDIVEMVKSVTKFAVRIQNPLDIRYLLEKAIYIAKNSRRGPVLIDIPMDIQRAEIDPKKLKGFNPSKLKINVDNKQEIIRKIEKSFTFLNKAKRPVVIAGGGIRYSDMTEGFKKLVGLMGIPIVSTWSAIDILSHDHPLYIGQIGVYGNRGANFCVQNSDFIISFGSRLDTRITGGKPETFAREAKKIIIDVDRDELFKNRGLNPDIGIVADLKNVLPLFLKYFTHLKKPEINAWVKRSKQWRENYPKVLPGWRKRKQKVDPYVFIEALSKLLKHDAVVVTDCGANLTWTIQAFHVKGRQKVFSAMGNSPMGYSLSAAIGASFALGKKDVYCIIGDGGFQLNIQELQTISYYKIPLKVFILNNHSYGIIKQFQKMYFEGAYEASSPQKGYSVPDFIRICRAYNLKTDTIDNHRELEKKIKKIIKTKGSFICDVIIPDDAQIIPKLEFGKPIEDLSPPLPRKEFNENMIIKPLK